MIELALALTLLVPLFMGLVQFGLGLLVYHEMVDAVQAGARYASLLAYDSASETPSAAYVAAVRQVTLGGNPRGGLRPDDVRVTVRFERRVPMAVTVAVERYGAGLPFRFFRTLARPTATFPYAGVFKP
jgi:Flp pilus assembly protein TadG